MLSVLSSVLVESVCMGVVGGSGRRVSKTRKRKDNPGIRRLSANTVRAVSLRHLNACTVVRSRFQPLFVFSGKQGKMGGLKKEQSSNFCSQVLCTALRANAGSSAPMDESLPLALVRKLVKTKLEALEAAAHSESGAKPPMVQKEALTAFSEACKVFIHFLTATAHDLCRDAKRQVITPEDVLKALEETEFADFDAPLRELLNSEFVLSGILPPRRAHPFFVSGMKEKAAFKKESTKKRKAEELDKAEQRGTDGTNDEPPKDAAEAEPRLDVEAEAQEEEKAEDAAATGGADEMEAT